MTRYDGRDISDGELLSTARKVQPFRKRIEEQEATIAKLAGLLREARQYIYANQELARSIDAALAEVGK